MDSGFWKLDSGLDCCNQSRLMHSLHFIYYFPSVGCWSSLHHRRKTHFSSPRHYYVNHRPISPAFHLIIAASGALAPLNRLFKVSPGQTQNLTAFFFGGNGMSCKIPLPLKALPSLNTFKDLFKNSPEGNLLLFYVNRWLGAECVSVTAGLAWMSL